MSAILQERSEKAAGVWGRPPLGGGSEGFWLPPGPPIIRTRELAFEL